MDFDKWLERLPDTGPYVNDEGSAKLGWNGCKKEIISIMEARSEQCCGTKAVELDRMIAVIRKVV